MRKLCSSWRFNRCWFHNDLLGLALTSVLVSRAGCYYRPPFHSWLGTDHHWNLPWMSCILKFRSLKISLETLERSFHRGEKKLAAKHHGIYEIPLFGYLILKCSFSLSNPNFSKLNCFHVYRKLITWSSHAKSPVIHASLSLTRKQSSTN